jgi:hypothetical protein
MLFLDLIPMEFIIGLAIKNAPPLSNDHNDCINVVAGSAGVLGNDTKTDGLPTCSGSGRFDPNLRRQMRARLIAMFYSAEEEKRIFAEQEILSCFYSATMWLKTCSPSAASARQLSTSLTGFIIPAFPPTKTLAYRRMTVASVST